MGKYSVWDRPYRPDRKEGRYRGRERNVSPYCPTRGIAIMYDFRVTIDTGNNSVSIGTGNNERAIWGIYCPLTDQSN